MARRDEPELPGELTPANGDPELAVHAGEARYRALIEATASTVWTTDALGRVAEDSPSWRAFTGQSLEEWLGAGWLDAIHPEDRDKAGRQWAEAVAAGRPVDTELRLRHADSGGWRLTRVRAVPMRDPEGRIQSWVGTNTDIELQRQAETKLQHSEARLRFMSRLDEALRMSRDAPAAMGAAAELLARQLGASRTAYADVDADSDRFFIRNDYAVPGIPSSAGTYSLDLFGSRAAADMRSGRTLVIRDVAGELAPADGREMFLSIGIGAIVCCPLVKDGRLVAMMAVHQDRPRRWQPDEIALVEAVVERCWSHVERVGAEARLRESEARYRTLFEALDAGFCMIEVLFEGERAVDYRFLEVNPAFVAQTGLVDAAGKRMRELAPAHEEHWFEIYGRVARTGMPARFENEAAALGRWYDVHAFRVGPSEANRVAVLFNDISERRRAEIAVRELNETLEARVSERTAELVQAQEALRQSQKLDSMGQLTGGVAHDVNNLLTPIMGALDLLQRRRLGGDREQRLIEGALSSAERVKVLVQRLLAFARRQPLQPTAVDVLGVVEGMAGLVASTTGPQINVVVDAGRDLPPAHADANQLEMALLNLSVNARDAMPDGGTLRITVSEDHVAAGNRTELRPGRYIRLSVADTGTGMDEATLARAVEPFFSTKGVGKGTGLGLSMVHGLAAQLGGALSISSRPGLGTNVQLWLPVSNADAGTTERAAEAEPQPASGTALLVDDEDLVRGTTADMLAELGYAVVEASSAEEALRLLDGGLVPDLLVTDHLMLGLSGTELAREVSRRGLGVKTLVVSGYAEVESVAPDLPRLEKPFRRADLAASLAAL